MPKKAASIPVNIMLDKPETGISIEKLSFTNAGPVKETGRSSFEEGTQSHRHDSHSFYLLEKGSVTVEIDFQTYRISSPSIIYIHPSQVHRTTAFDKVTVNSLAIDNENLNPGYLALLEAGITPAKPLVVNRETFLLLSEAISLCLKCFKRSHDTLYHSLLNDSCNVLAGLFIAQYLLEAKPTHRLSRFETVAKAFREQLERSYTTTKRPADYARLLNLSVTYLNECVKSATGYPVSHHIQQRVVLEARRLLYHSNKSVKEIADELGYDDHPYFSRLFVKITGATPVAFRNKNRG